MMIKLSSQRNHKAKREKKLKSKLLRRKTRKARKGTVLADNQLPLHHPALLLQKDLLPEELQTSVLASQNERYHSMLLRVKEPAIMTSSLLIGRLEFWEDFEVIIDYSYYSCIKYI